MRLITLISHTLLIGYGLTMDFYFYNKKHLHKCVPHLSSPDIASFLVSIHSPDEDALVSYKHGPSTSKCP
jgi:hypothetical protein